MSDKNKEEEKNHKKKAFKLIDVEENIQNKIQNKILRLLDKQLQILEDEVNLLKFKITHNKMSDDELQMIYEALTGALELEE